MGRISERLKIKTTPLANKKAIIKGDKYRFTILTDRLVRIEYDKEGKFTDKATEAVINRNFDVPRYTVEKTDDYLKVSTEYVTFTYNYGEFAKNTLHSLLLTVCTAQIVPSLEESLGIIPMKLQKSLQSLCS